MPINPMAQELLNRESIVRQIADRRVAFVERASSSPYTSYATCDRCRRRYWGIASIADMSFKCVICMAEEQFPIPDFDAPGPKPKLDVDDFARL